MAELWLTSLDSTLRLPVSEIGTYGTASDLSFTTRWGEGACGMYEASWSMPLPPDFHHPLLRRGTLVEVTNGPWALGSRLVLSEPAKGTGLADPWQLTATGVGREVEGDNAFTAFSLVTGDSTSIPSAAVDFAVSAGWQVDGRAASVPTSAIGGTTTPEELMTVGSLLSAAAESTSRRWGVGQDNLVFLASDPATPTYQVMPGAAALGTTDTDYASVVWLRYLDSATMTYKSVYAQNTQTEARFGRKEYIRNLIGAGAVSTATAQAWADGIMARVKGRLGWTNGLTLTSEEILTMGGMPADLSKVAEDVGSGCMVRLHGIWSDLLEFTGQTYLDVIISEARYVDGAQTIDLSPQGLAPRDLAAVVEAVTGYREAA
jgi:hypothetical protein